MENKYFTPDIEDLHIGYQCEYKDSSGYFRPTIIQKTNVKFITFNHDYNLYRTPYLTKEQIEAEGWYKINNNYPIQTFKHPINVDVEVIYNYDTNHLFITIPGKIMFTEPKVEYRASKFSGECRDINTFRKICKLLGI